MPMRQHSPSVLSRRILKRNQRSTNPLSMIRALLWGLTVSTFMLAQQPSPSNTPDARSDKTSGPQSPEWRGLSAEEKLRYDARHLFDFDNLVYAGIGAAFDQWRDRPSDWGQGGGALAE